MNHYRRRNKIIQKMLRRQLVLVFTMAFTAVWFWGCDSTQAKNSVTEADVTEESVQIPETHVKVVRAKRDKLILKQFVNGKIEAFDRVEIKFEANGRIVSSDLQNGKYVSKGSVLAKIDDRDLQYELANGLIELEVAENDRKERMMLVSGGDFGDSTVTKQQRKYINIVSGYNKARQAIEETRHQLTKTLVLAPFEGLVADLKIKQEQFVSSGEVLCTLVNPRSYQATFAVTEALALKIQKGQEVTVSATARPELKVGARVDAINPLVDDNGLVTVYASLKKAQTRFFEGMNIQVVLENASPPVVLVPKESLVLRSGREVIFTYDSTEDRAKWNYVTVAFENDELLGISEGLEDGDAVIVEGNLNLDHDSKVALKAS